VTGRTGRLWIVDPSVRHPETQGVQEVLRGWSGESRIFRPGLEPSCGPAPGLGYDTDGVVILGSAASVHDARPWLEPLASWLAPIVRGEVELPLLGICFGHQLIAHLAGGEVGYVRQDRAKTVGVETSQLLHCRLLPGVDSLRTVVSHCEEIRSVPHGFRLIARRTTCCLDGIEHERLPIFGFQFHPEAREEFAQCAGIDLRLLDERLRLDGQRLLASFLDWVRGPSEKKRAGRSSAGSSRGPVEGD
jgi:GMP synthase-like glutamine amidotransferase